MESDITNILNARNIASKVLEIMVNAKISGILIPGTHEIPEEAKEILAYLQDKGYVKFQEKTSKSGRKFITGSLPDKGRELYRKITNYLAGEMNKDF